MHHKCTGFALCRRSGTLRLGVRTLKLSAPPMPTPRASWPVPEPTWSARQRSLQSCAASSMPHKLRRQMRPARKRHASAWKSSSRMPMQRLAGKTPGCARCVLLFTRMFWAASLLTKLSHFVRTVQNGWQKQSCVRCLLSLGSQSGLHAADGVATQQQRLARAASQLRGGTSHSSQAARRIAAHQALANNCKS